MLKTFEAELNRILERKRKLQREFDCVGTNWIADYSDDEIRSLFAYKEPEKGAKRPRGRPTNDAKRPR